MKLFFRLISLLAVFVFEISAQSHPILNLDHHDSRVPRSFAQLGRMRQVGNLIWGGGDLRSGTTQYDADFMCRSAGGRLPSQVDFSRLAVESLGSGSMGGYWGGFLGRGEFWTGEAGLYFDGRRGVFYSLKPSSLLYVRCVFDLPPQSIGPSYLGSVPDFDPRIHPYFYAPSSAWISNGGPWMTSPLLPGDSILPLIPAMISAPQSYFWVSAAVPQFYYPAAVPPLEASSGGPVAALQAPSPSGELDAPAPLPSPPLPSPPVKSSPSVVSVSSDDPRVSREFAALGEMFQIGDVIWSQNVAKASWTDAEAFCGTVRAILPSRWQYRELLEARRIPSVPLEEGATGWWTIERKPMNRPWPYVFNEHTGQVHSEAPSDAQRLFMCVIPPKCWRRAPGL
jgi:hypothetical protein